MACDGVFIRTPLSEPVSKNPVSMPSVPLLSDELETSLLLVSRSVYELFNIDSNTISLLVLCVIIMSLSLLRYILEGYSLLSRC